MRLSLVGVPWTSLDLLISFQNYHTLGPSACFAFVVDFASLPVYGTTL